MSCGDWQARLARHGDRDFWCLAYGAGGAFSFGEASAMPNYSTESALEQTLSVQELLRARPEPSGTSADEIEDALRGLPLTPAVRFGAETALARWAARAEGLALAEWWGADLASTACCNGLVPHTLNAADAATLAVQQRNAGVQCLKVKVAGTSADLQRIEAIAAAAPELSLRLDANAAWSEPQAVAFLARLSSKPIDYCEQPLAPDAALPRCIGAPIALDETLRHEKARAAWLGCDAESLNRYAQGEGPMPAMSPHVELRALVLKPTVLGGTAICLRWATLARELGLDAVFTHTFEGPLGLAACRAAALAASVGEVPQGLARFAALDAWSGMRESDFPASFDMASVQVALNAADTARV